MDKSDQCCCELNGDATPWAALAVLYIYHNSNDDDDEILKGKPIIVMDETFLRSIIFGRISFASHLTPRGVLSPLDFGYTSNVLHDTRRLE